MNPALSISSSDEAFYRDRKAMLMYPVIVLPFIMVLYFMFGGGKGQRYIHQQAASDKPGVGSFNATMPTAKNGKINDRDVDAPGYGKAAVGQVLSSFTHTQKDSATHGLKAIPVNQTSASATNHASSLAAAPVVVNSPTTTSNSVKHYSPRRNKSASAKATGAYYYHAPGVATPGYAGTGTDQQVAAQLQTYQNARYVAQPTATVGANQPPQEPISTNRVGEGEDTQPATIQLSDNLTATRLSEPADATDAFNTAPTMGSRRLAERAVLSGGNSYGSRKTVAWMIPVVVHEDQTFKSGNTVKLRLTKEISADGITIPANTILHAVCQSGEDRLRMVVHSLQLNGQLIPLDLEVYDMDGLAGVNMPGLSNQVGGQLKSSAIQGLQLPGVGGLVNTVASTARMQASQNLRQPMVRLKAGYNLYLKAQ